MTFQCRICYRELLEDWQRPTGVRGDGAGLWCWDCIRNSRQGDEMYPCSGACGMPHATAKAALQCCTEPEFRSPVPKNHINYYPEPKTPGGPRPPPSPEELRRRVEKSPWHKGNWKLFDLKKENDEDDTHPEVPEGSS
jgi:hypothetical protein